MLKHEHKETSEVHRKAIRSDIYDYKAVFVPTVMPKTDITMQLHKIILSNYVTEIFKVVRGIWNRAQHVVQSHGKVCA